jgi:hypothetical protein
MNKGWVKVGWMDGGLSDSRNKQKDIDSNLLEICVTMDFSNKFIVTPRDIFFHSNSPTLMTTTNSHLTYTSQQFFNNATFQSNQQANLQYHVEISTSLPSATFQLELPI